MVGGKHDHPQAVADLHIPTTGAEGHVLKCDSVPKTCCYCLRPELGYSKNIHQHNRKDVSWIFGLDEYTISTIGESCNCTPHIHRV